MRGAGSLSAACLVLGCRRLLESPLLNDDYFMRNILLLSLVSALLSACQPPLPEVPPSNRTVVAPSGSSEAVKSWSRTTKQESSALLGPLGNTERR